MSKILPVIDNTKRLEQKQSQAKAKAKDDSSILDSLGAAGIGALNQFNLLSDVTGAFPTAVGVKLDDSISNEDWDKKSLWDKYRTNANYIQEGINRIEDAHPVASLVGNLAGGIATGGAIAKGGLAAAKGVSKLAPSVTKKLVETVGTTPLKVAGTVGGSSVVAGVDSAMFERDPEKKGEAFKQGAKWGAAIPLALGGVKKAVTAGKKAKKYAENAPEILEQRKAGKQAVSDLQERVKTKIDDIEPEMRKEASNLADTIKETNLRANSQQQLKELDLVDKLTEVKTGLQKQIREATNGGFEVLDKNKKLPTKDLEKSLTSYLDKVDTITDVTAPVFKKYLDRVRTYGDSISELDLKRLIKSMYTEVDNVGGFAQDVHQPAGIKAIKQTADIGNDLLKKSNPEYAAMMKPLAEKVEKVKAIENAFKITKSKDGSNKLITAKALKNYKGNKLSEQALDDLKEMTGVDLRPDIDNVISSSNTLDRVNINDTDKLANLIASNSNDSNFIKYISDLEKFENIFGTNSELGKAIGNIRTKYQVDLLNKAKKLMSGEKGTNLQKKMKDIKLDDLDDNSLLGRITGNASDSDLNIAKAKDQIFRNDINDLSTFLGEDSAKNIKDIELEKIYDLMGQGKANGSRNVNWGAILASSALGGLGGAAKGSVGGIVGSAIGAAAGATAGALRDYGTMGRIQRELINAGYNPKVQALGKSLQYGGMTTIPTEVQKYENRSNNSLSSYNEYMKARRMSELVQDQKNINKEYFQREGS